MTNLIDIYNEIENSINSLYDFDLSSQYKKMIDGFNSAIEDLYKYYGIRRLKIDIEQFHKNEIVKIEQGEGGCFLLGLDENDSRIVDLYEHMDLSIDELFF